MSQDNPAGLQSAVLKETGEAALPVARRERWQPIRGGLLNIYRYDYQEFHYEDGRLLLRGNNGTGKSRVLALQLPFLLDGEIVPQRVEPDQDQAKRMDWNLLLGGKHDDRLGYTWTEFGRVTESGETEYKTLGCALRAVQGRGIAQQWFFITSQRIGRDLFLENEAGQPLSKAKLEGVIGSHGQVFGGGKIEEDRREYRRAVDQALFQLGDRYDALINLLIQLRQPQLSRTLNEGKLSDALSEALPPLPEAVLGDVAEAFRSLETDRQELSDFKAAKGSAELFLKEYQRYVQIAARRRAEEVRKAHSAYETTMRRLRTAEGEHEEATQRLEILNAQIAELAIEESKAAAAERTLRDSPEMKDAKALDEARVAAETAQREADNARNEAGRTAATLLKDERQRQLAADKAESALQAALEFGAKALGEAAAAGLEQRHREAVERLGPMPMEVARLETTAAQLRELVKRRLEAIGHVKKLDERVESARQKAALAQQTFSQAESQLNEGIEGERAAASRLESATASLMTDYQAWAEGTTELEAPDVEQIEDDFADWCSAPQGDSPLVSTIKGAERAAAQLIESERAGSQGRLQTARQELAQLEAELHRLRDGYHEPPPSPHTRDNARRAERAGAPLWALCEFRPTVPEAERAPIEAALEASGLLDAWITPDGRVLDPDDHDSVLSVGISPPVAEGRALDLVLAPSIDRQDKSAGSVTEETVGSILRRIGFGSESGTIWVDQDGRWQLGPLTGRWSKPAAQHIGHAAREAARRQRMEQLAKEIEAANGAIDLIKRALEELAQRSSRLALEVSQAPSDGAVRSALAQLEAARNAVARLRLRLTEAEARFHEAQRVMKQTASERDAAAADLGLAGWVDKLSELADAIHAYSQTLSELWPALRAQAEAQSQLVAAEERLAEVRALRALRQEQQEAAQRHAAGARETFQTLESTVGAAVLQIQERLTHAVARVAQVRTERQRAGEEEVRKKIGQAVAKKGIDDATEELTAREQERGVAITGLVSFAGTRQLSVAHSEFAELEPAPWSVARAVELARRIDAVLSQVDHSDDAWSRNQKDIHSHFETLQSSLRSHGYMPEASVSDGIFVVSIQFQGKACTAAELRDRVVTVIQERQELLDAREREVLENYLIDEVAEHLHDLLHRAFRWKEEINAELSERPMSTGLTLRFVWESRPDLPQAFAEARRLLLNARGTWSPAQRAAVGEFLQQQIKSVRATNDTGTWQDHLTQAFDYRKWHQFGVERKQDGVWKRLTRRTHGTGSGGEKAIALTLPQLAAAAAHYRSADKHAPRLILLDEAFVGVDKNMRAKCMDLLRVFDLDVVMTSESEWGCYATVPAIAIYQLSAREGIDAVHAARWVWNGKQRVRDDSPLPSARHPGVEHPGELIETA